VGAEPRAWREGQKEGIIMCLASSYLGNCEGGSREQGRGARGSCPRLVTRQRYPRMYHVKAIDPNKDDDDDDDG